MFKPKIDSEGDTEVTPIIDCDNQLENHIGTDGDHLAKEIIGDVVECTIGDRDQEDVVFWFLTDLSLGVEKFVKNLTVQGVFKT